MPKLGIIAGAGGLPGQIAAACRETGKEHCILAFEGSADAGLLGESEVTWIQMAKISKAFEEARKAGIKEIVMVGNIPRPSVRDLMRDPRSAKFILKVGSRFLGDDNILSAVVKELEETEGFKVLSPDIFLENILARSGAYGSFGPDTETMADIDRGIEVVEALGRLDVGQAVIIQNGLVVGVEAAEGTDKLINRCSEFIQEGLPGGVLVKASKPAQERRVDLPAVGISTVKRASKAGLRGIAVEVDRTLIIDQVEMINVANRAGIFIFGFEIEGRQ